MFHLFFSIEKAIGWPFPQEGSFDFEDLPFSPELRHLLEYVEVSKSVSQATPRLKLDVLVEKLGGNAFSSLRNMLTG